MADRTTTSITGATRLAAVIGHPVRHSLSPRIHNAAFTACGLDWVYLAFDVAPDAGARAVEAMRTLGLAGMSVTMPHKEAVVAAADSRTVAAERLGAANCLFWRDNQIVADSTDGDGFVAAFEQRFGQPLADQTVAVFGAGGAARSIIEALGRNKAASVLVFNRSPERLAEAVGLADQARPGHGDELAAVDVIVNASAIGMSGGTGSGKTPFDVTLIQSRHIVIDIVYKPAITPLLAAAADRGASTQGGVAMLVHQAALAFQLWTERPAPLDVMLSSVADDLD
ncbi:MAG: shikimate dehydrogenase [Acidimicrobiia bacterium]|nr:shikimate dehydrogenase [Acidimicrobiia bacterium]